MMAYSSFLVPMGISPKNTYFPSMIAGEQDDRHNFLGIFIDIADLPIDAQSFHLMEINFCQSSSLFFLIWNHFHSRGFGAPFPLHHHPKCERKKKKEILNTKKDTIDLIQYWLKDRIDLIHYWEGYNWLKDTIEAI